MNNCIPKHRYIPHLITTFNKNLHLSKENLVYFQTSDRKFEESTSHYPFAFDILYHSFSLNIYRLGGVLQY